MRAAAGLPFSCSMPPTVSHYFTLPNDPRNFPAGMLDPKEWNLQTAPHIWFWHLGRTSSEPEKLIEFYDQSGWGGDLDNKNCFEIGLCYSERRELAPNLKEILARGLFSIYISGRLYKFDEVDLTAAEAANQKILNAPFAWLDAEPWLLSKEQCAERWPRIGIIDVDPEFSMTFMKWKADIRRREKEARKLAQQFAT